MRRPLMSGSMLVCALLALPAVASASPQQRSTFMDDDLLLFRGDEVADKTLTELKALGVTQVRVTLKWDNFAPGAMEAKRPAAFKDARDPGQYAPVVFDLHDHVIRVAKRLGIDVLLNVTGGAPLWATGKGNKKRVTAFKPDPKGFGEFVEMIGRRYDGTRRDENQGGSSLPRVTAWSIWNEPNQGAQLQPQVERVKVRVKATKTRKARTKTVKRLASPRLYRGLYRSAHAGLGRSGHGSDTILLGETAPIGVERDDTTSSIRPIRFLDALFCLNPKGRRALRGASAKALGCDFPKAGPLRTTGFAHHPYSITSSPHTPDRNVLDVTLADRARLYALLDAAARVKRLPARLPVWHTELGWQTNPPDPIRGVSLDDGARFLAEAEQITRADPRVVAATQFLLNDSPARDEAGASQKRQLSTYQSGLKFVDGKAKPALDAYRLPLAALGGGPLPAGKPATLWGMVRPGLQGGSVRLTFTPAEGPAVDVPTGPVDATGAFSAAVTPPSPGVYRFTWTLPAPPTPPPPLIAIGPPAPAPAAPSFVSAAVPVRMG